jgi:protein-tyrosine phosphatase
VPQIHVLFVCTGNIYRSPMAEAFLSGISRRRQLDLTAGSAGTLEGDRPVAPVALELMGTEGPAMTGHRSRLIERSIIESADLVVGMCREHVREVVLVDPSAFPRTFTLKELVRRGETHGPRLDQPVGEWLLAIGRGRRRDDLAGSSQLDDVIDPIGGTSDQLKATAEEIHDLVDRLVWLIEPRR